MTKVLSLISLIVFTVLVIFTPKLYACDTVRIAAGVERNFVQTHTITPIGTIHKDTYYTFGLVEAECRFHIGRLNIGGLLARHGVAGGIKHLSDFTTRGDDPVKSDSVNLKYEIIF